MTASDQGLVHAELPGVMTGKAALGMTGRGALGMAGRDALGMTGGTPLKFAHGKLISRCLWFESYYQNVLTGNFLQGILVQRK